MGLLKKAWQQNQAGAAAVGPGPLAGRPKPAGTGGGKVLIVECARGFAAVYVLIHHVFFLGNYAHSCRAAHFAASVFAYGHQAVLLFFLVSGFSIHHSHRNRPLTTRAGCLDYYYLRWRRIYPIFLISLALAFGLALVNAHFQPATAAALHPFLQPVSLAATMGLLTDNPIPGHWFTVIPFNGPLWSLSYEAAYYLVYPLFWLGAWRYGINRMLLVAGGISLVMTALEPGGWPSHLTNVFALYWLWCAGAWLAEMRSQVRTGARRLVVSKCFYFAALLTTFAIIKLGENNLPVILTDSLYGLLLGLMMTGYVVQFAPRVAGMDGQAGLILGGMTLLLAVAPHFLPLQVSYSGWLVKLGLMVFWLGGCVMGSWTVVGTCSAIVRPFLTVGAWSYALYVIHWPILYFGSAWLGLLGWSQWLLFALIPLILWLARWLELGCQPAMASWMDRWFRPGHTTARRVRSSTPEL